jgi:hypothetical protein
MPAIKNRFSPRPYASRQDQNLHSGVVSVTGTGAIDLGVGHNNFVCTPSIKGSLETATTVYWDYGSTPGTIAFSVFDAGVLSVVARNVAFNVIVDSSVG